jgi:hypothetical protein
MMLYLTLLAILVTTPESCTFDFCSDDFEEKNKKNTYGKNHALEYIPSWVNAWCCIVIEDP